MRDAAGAISFYTRLPLPLDAGRQRTFADIQWAAPLAGAVVGIGVGGALWLALLPGLPPQLAAAFAIAAGVALTGALHEDGLADTADGFGGGRSRDDKLAIMRDSRIGSYGVLALGLSLLARWAALAALAEASIAGAILASVAAHAGSRAVLPALLAALPPARADGLSAGIGTMGNGTTLAALALGFVFLLPCGLAFAVVSSLVLGLVALLVARLALAQIGGQTGDVLGCAQQAGEIALLSAATVFLLP
ncbi:MAG: adenosylcobinamide-GDP ribazoletransferase [Aquamicrobium sp.]|uniref:adenosylcobinamide-GDP ribazoletransferase n=1 Tax=Aquamicrobium sp. TaxID=1872579 RepID=UPI00349EFCC7|nr:adenosylcobinamide-GDP ribazoletransferase [Aquamicrobium sp.]